MINIILLISGVHKVVFSKGGLRNTNVIITKGGHSVYSVCEPERFTELSGVILTQTHTHQQLVNIRVWCQKSQTQTWCMCDACCGKSQALHKYYWHG